VISATLANVLGEPFWSPDPNAVLTLWQVEATLIGLGLALLVLAVQSSEGTAALRTDVALSASYYAVTGLGLALIVVTGISVALAGTAFGNWLATLVMAAAGAWTIGFFAAIREAVLTGDRVHRVLARRAIVLEATNQSLNAELVRNVAASLLGSLVREAGGEFSPFFFVREHLTEDHRIRLGRTGEVADVNTRSLAGIISTSKIDGIRLSVSLRLWEQVSGSTIIVEANEQIPDRTAQKVRGSLFLRTAKSSTDVAVQINLLRLEAQTGLGPDLTVLDAVLDVYEGILEEYALGWRRFVPALEAGHVSSFIRGSGVPIAAIRDALYGLMEGAIDARAPNAFRKILFFPAHLVGLAVEWRAPAYLEFSSLARVGYALASRARDERELQQRELAWMYLVEVLEFLLPQRRAPYVVVEDEEMVAAAQHALRESLIEVLRAAATAGDTANFKEGLRRWRIAEGHRGQDIPDGARFPVPLGWDVFRRVRAGTAKDAADLFRSVMGDADVGTIWKAVDQQLDERERWADLDRWVALEMPTHEAHFSDTDTDLFTLLVVAVASLTDQTRAAELPPLSGRLHGHRTSFDAAVTAVRADAPRLERLFGVHDLVGRVDRLEQAWLAGVQQFEHETRQELRHTPLSANEVSAFTEALQKEWRLGHPIAMLESGGALTYGSATPTRHLRLLIRQLDDKRIFVSPAGIEGSAASVGEIYAQHVSRLVNNRISTILSKLRLRTFGKRHIAERLREAIRQLRRDDVAVVVLLPRRWELVEAIQKAGQFEHPPRDATAGMIGTFDDVPIYELSDPDLPWAAVASLPDGLSVDFGSAAPGTELAGTVSRIDDDLAVRLLAEGTKVTADSDDSAAEALQLKALVLVETSMSIRINHARVTRISLRQT
jgi:hypothetical protein